MTGMEHTYVLKIGYISINCKRVALKCTNYRGYVIPNVILRKLKITHLIVSKIETIYTRY